jgi:hypothetical protein
VIGLVGVDAALEVLDPVEPLVVVQLLLLSVKVAWDLVCLCGDDVAELHPGEWSSLGAKHEPGVEVDKETPVVAV